MKNLILSVACIGSLVCIMSCGSSKQATYKHSSKADPVEELVNEFKADGYKQVSVAFTMYELVSKHREQLLQNKNLIEIYGEGGGQSSTIARLNASNAAAIAYATAAGNVISGKVEREMMNAEEKSFEIFHAAFIQDVTKFIMPLLKESIMLSKTDPAASPSERIKVKIAFLIDEEEAKNARDKALTNALEKSEIGQKFGRKIREYINEKVEPNQE